MRSIDARHLLAEFVVIVVGVLAALGVDQWRENRTDRAAEAHYVDRLISELASDSTLNTGAIGIGARKTAALTEVIDALSDSSAVRRNPSLAWPDMGFTYARPDLQTTTFDELRSSGGLALIRSEDLRYRIGDHYRQVLHHYERLDERRTAIAWTVADLFASIAWGGATNVGMPSAAIDSAFFAAPNAEYRFQRLVGPEYQGLLNQERIYGNSMVDISEQILGLTTQLLNDLREYRASLR